MMRSDGRNTACWLVRPWGNGDDTQDMGEPSETKKRGGLGVFLIDLCRRVGVTVLRFFSPDPSPLDLSNIPDDELCPESMCQLRKGHQGLCVLFETRGWRAFE